MNLKRLVERYPNEPTFRAALERWRELERLSDPTLLYERWKQSPPPIIVASCEAKGRGMTPQAVRKVVEAIGGYTMKIITLPGRRQERAWVREDVRYPKAELDTYLKRRERNEP